MGTLSQDLRYAWRMLWKSPVFTVAALLTLAIGIGANTAIFTVVNAIVLRPLPYQKPRQLVFLNEANASFDGMSVSWLNFKDWQKRTQSFTGLAAMRGSAYNASWGNQVDMLLAGEVTHELFEVVGVKPAMGRALTADDDKPDAPGVAVLSHHTWTGLFAADPNVLGRTIELNREPFTIVGVMPATFHFPHYRRNDLWASLGRLSGDRGMQERGNHPGIYVVGRVKDGVAVETAAAEMKALARALEQEYPESNAGNTVRVRPLHEALVEDLQTPGLVLLAAAALVLLIGCANVANLVLARSAARQAEVAVRAALGAGRGRLARQFFTESLLLAGVGALLGGGVAWAGVRFLAASIPENIPRGQEISADWRVLLFAVGAALFTGLLFGLAPALQTARQGVNSVLREGGRSGGSTSAKQRFRRVLVAAEFAFAVVLLVGAALMLKSLWNVLAADPGIDTHNVLTAQVRLTGADYEDRENVVRFVDRLATKVRDIPGVSRAGVVNPLFGGWQRGAYIEGDPLPKPGEYDPVDFAMVTPGGMEALGIRLRQGRFFTQEDFVQKRNFVIVDETFVQKRLQGKNPLGLRLKTQHNPDGDEPWYEIIGVVGHVKNYGVDEESRIEMWLTYANSPVAFGTVVAKTEGDPASIAAALRNAVRELDAGLPLFQVRSLEEHVARRTGERRVVSFLLGLFGATALLLAAVGIYGVMSLAVAQRTQEMGVRLALGAQPGDVVRLVLSQGFQMAVIGLAVGVAGAAGLMRLVESQLFGVNPGDLVSYGAVLGILLGVALAASALPALRATRVDPVNALRYE